MDTHPAYPSPATLDREARAEQIAMREWRNNEKLRDILRLARDKIADQIDVTGFSMIHGLDLSDVLDTLDSIMPALHDDAMERRLDEWAAERAGDVS